MRTHFEFIISYFSKKKYFHSDIDFLQKIHCNLMILILKSLNIQEGTMHLESNIYYNYFGITEELIQKAHSIEEDLSHIYSSLDKIKEINQLKVLKAMQEARLSDIHFNSSTGYGYNDIGRDKIEEIFSKIFNTEDALVRPTLVNGTHSLSTCLQALLMPNDTMLSITGKPYDTLDEVIGIKDHPLSLKQYNIHYEQINLLSNGNFDKENIINYLKINQDTKMVYIQRSKGYSRRKSITIESLKEVSTIIKSINPQIIIMLDNCYGEFIENKEPTDVGVDIMAGSLIKNPGGGLAITGGYIVGKKQYVELAAQRLTCASIGKECGLTFGTNRLTLQGLFIAPSTVNAALKGAIFCAKLFQDDNYDVYPIYDEPRSDIIQAIALNSEADVIKFCKAIQAAAPVDSYVVPEPWDMPGYDSKVIMAAGAFIQGSSIELSADAPIKSPYTVYFQGGLTYEHSKLGALMAYSKIKND